MAKRDETLTEALARHGITHRKGTIDGCRELIDRDGNPIGEFNAFAGWNYVCELEGRPQIFKLSYADFAADASLSTPA